VAGPTWIKASLKDDRSFWNDRMSPVVLFNEVGISIELARLA
jgi:hypothetical protein